MFNLFHEAASISLFNVEMLRKCREVSNMNPLNLYLWREKVGYRSFTKDLAQDNRIEEINITRFQPLKVPREVLDVDSRDSKVICDKLRESLKCSQCSKHRISWCGGSRRGEGTDTDQIQFVQLGIVKQLWKLTINLSFSVTHSEGIVLTGLQHQLLWHVLDGDIDWVQGDWQLLAVVVQVKVVVVPTEELLTTSKVPSGSGLSESDNPTPTCWKIRLTRGI